MTAHSPFKAPPQQTSVVGFDIETYGNGDLNVNPTPRPVCCSFAGGEDTLQAAQAAAQDCCAVFRIVQQRIGKKNWWLVVHVRDVLPVFQTLRNKGVVFVTINGRFDVSCLHAHPGTGFPDALRTFVSLVEQEKPQWRDIRVRQKVIDNATRKMFPEKGRYSLAGLVKRHFGVDISADKGPDAWRLRYHELENIPVREWPEKALKYAGEDALWNRRVYLAQSQKTVLVAGREVVNAAGDVLGEAVQLQADLALRMMTVEGYKVDPEMVSTFERAVQADVDMTKDAAKRLGFLRINRCKSCDGTGKVGEYPALKTCPTCNGWEHDRCLEEGIYKRKAQAKIGSEVKRRLQAIVAHHYREHPPLTEPSKSHPHGQIKTDAETLQGIADADETIADYCAGLFAKKLLSTYVPPLKAALDAAGRVHPGYNFLVRSNRTSSFGPNVQNPPQRGQFRECAVASEGNVLCSADWSSLELRTLAQTFIDLFGYSVMGDVINAGRDLHLWFAAKLMGVSYEEAESRYKAGDPVAKQKRQGAKPANFGIPGGMGAKTLVQYAKGYGVELTINQGYDLARQWKTAFPESQDFFDMVSNMCNTSPDPEGRWDLALPGCDFVRGGVGYTNGCNTYFQGRAAWGAKRVMWALLKACYLDEQSPLYGVRPWGFIHDEFLLEGPETTAHIWAPEVSRLMVEGMEEQTPNICQEAPAALMHRWYKAADPVFDSEGRLLPWVPTHDLPTPLQKVLQGRGHKKTDSARWSSFADFALRQKASFDVAVRFADSELQAVWQTAA